MPENIDYQTLHNDLLRLGGQVQKMLVMAVSGLLSLAIMGFFFAYNFHGRTSVLEHVNKEGKRWTFEMQQDYQKEQQIINTGFKDGINNLGNELQGLKLTVGTIQSDVKYIRKALEGKNYYGENNEIR